MGEKALANLQSPSPAVPQVVLPEDQSVALLPATARLTTVALSQKVEIQVPDWLLTEPPTWSTWGCPSAVVTIAYSKAHQTDRIFGWKYLQHPPTATPRHSCHVGHFLSFGGLFCSFFASRSTCTSMSTTTTFIFASQHDPLPD